MSFSQGENSRVHLRHCLHLSHTLSQTYTLQICPVTEDWAVWEASSIVRPRSGLRHAFLQMEVPSLEPANHLPMVKSEDFLLLFPVCPRILVGIKNKPKDRWFHVQVQVQAPPTALSKGTSMRTGACLTPDLCPTEHQPDEQSFQRSPAVPINGGVNKEGMACIYNGILLNR